MITHGNGPPLFLFNWGVAFELKRRRRHAALTSHGISSASRLAPARTRGPVAAATVAAMVGSLSAAENPYICSGKSLVSGLCAVPLPQLRTHSPGGAVDL
jgi:hypothetical protein